jgi:hypothetical protein
MTIILAESEKLLLIDMKGLHPLKDMIQLGHIDRGAVLRSVFTGEGMLSYRVSRNGLNQEVPLNDNNWIRYVSILERIHNKDRLRETFDKFIKHRYQDDWLKAQGRFTLGLTDDYIDREIRDPLIEKLATQTVYDTVMDRYLMFPVPDMAAISQVRRGIKNKIYDKDTNTYYGIKDKPYSLWFPYLGILNLMDVYPDTAEDDITRLAVEKGLHLGIKDDGHGNIIYKEDIGRVIEHDWGFEARIFAVFREGELQALAPNKMSPAEQRELISKTFRLFTRAMGQDKIVQKSTAEFYAGCYDLLRTTILQHPDKNVDDLWHYVMQPMREKGYALLHTNLYNRHPIKNFVFRCFYYFQEVLRLPSPALHEDIYWPTLEGKVPFEYKNEPFWVEFKKMHDDLLSNYELVYWVYREKIMSNVNDLKRAQQGRKPLGVPQKVQDDYVNDHVRNLMTDMHMDTLPKEGFLLRANDNLFQNGFTPIIAHSRRGLANPAGYEGARYAVMSGFLTNLISLMGTTGNTLYIQNNADESRHWDKGDDYNHGTYESARDFEFKIEHDAQWAINIACASTIADSIVFALTSTKNNDRHVKVTALKVLLVAAEHLRTTLDTGMFDKVFIAKRQNNSTLSWSDARLMVTPIIKQTFEQTLRDTSLNRLQSPAAFNILDNFLYDIYYNFLNRMCGLGDIVSSQDEQPFYDAAILNNLTPAPSAKKEWRFDWDRQDYVESVYKVLFIHEERYLKSA